MALLYVYKLAFPLLDRRELPAVGHIRFVSGRITLSFLHSSTPRPWVCGKASGQANVEVWSLQHISLHHDEQLGSSLDVKVCPRVGASNKHDGELPAQEGE